MQLSLRLLLASLFVNAGPGLAPRSVGPSDYRLMALGRFRRETVHGHVRLVEDYYI